MVTLEVSVWVTLKCNFCCTYCYEKDMDVQQTEMSKITAEKTVEYLLHYMEKNDYHECNLHFHGGEPMLNIQCIKYIVNKTKNSPFVFNYSITTNGSMLDEESSLFFAQNDIEISISIDGNSKTFNMYRKSKSGIDEYDNIIKNVKVLMEKKCHLSARMTIIPYFVQSFYNNVLFLLNVGFKKIDFALDMENSIWYENDFVKLVDETIKVEEYLMKNKMEDIEFSGKNNGVPVELSKCNGGISSLSIDCMGDIYPCTFLVGNNEFKIGHVSTGVKKEWKRKIKEINSLKMKECEGCTMLPLCIGNKCRLFNYKVNGDFTMPTNNICYMQNYYKLKLYQKGRE